MKKLHPVQQALYELLRVHQDDPLTIRELQERLDVSSPSVVHHHIQMLEKRGYLRRNPANPQDYQLLEDGPEKLIVHLNLYGMAQCGPDGTILSGSPVERIPISSRLLGFPSDEAFLVKARGDSMVPRINSGDLVIARRSSAAEDGDVVVCVNSEEAMIKKIHRGDAGIILHSLNPAYDPFIAYSDNFKIEGLVRGVISYSF